MLRIVFICLCIPLLSSCFTVGKDYTKPVTDINNNWNSAGGSDSTLFSPGDKKVPTKWWHNFNDKQLSSLIEKSLKYNHDIKAAEARIKEAVANHNAAFASLFPQISGIGSFKREKLGASSGERLDRSSNAGIRGSWDLDIFGGNKRKKEAALAAIESQEAERDKVRLAIVAEVARNYINLRQSQKQKRLILKNIEIQKETLTGTLEKRKVGSVTNLEVARAEAQVEATKVRLFQINTSNSIAINRLHVLTGEPSDNLMALLLEGESIPDVKDKMIVGTPLQVVAKHPDIRAAERELASRTALTGAAFAEMFPKLSLDGFFGASESNLFGAATPWDAAGNLLFPILNFCSLKAQVEAADARQEAAFEGYKQTVLTTLEAVENSFSSYKNEKKRLEKLAVVLEKRKSVVNIAKEQYTVGVITQLDLLLAQQNQLDAENDFVISEALAATNAIDLYESLGTLER